MNELIVKSKIPTLAELSSDTDVTIRENAVMVLLNQPPPEAWLKTHPMIANHKYIPIERIEYLLSRIFTKWWVEIKNAQVMANSVVVTVRVHVIYPLLGEEDHRSELERTAWQDGIGASVIQTDKGATAMDIGRTKSDAIMKAAPAAESYAVKDAAEKFGKLFGKDLSRKDQIGYDSLLKKPTINKEQERIMKLIDDCTVPKDLEKYKKDIPENLMEYYETKMELLINPK